MTILTSVAAILSLNLILLLGAAGAETRSGRTLIDASVAVLDVSLVSSSGLLGFLFFGRRRKILGVAFLLNLAIFALAAILRWAGVLFPRPLLFAADLYWLNLYLASLPQQFDILYPSTSSTELPHGR